MLETSLVDQQVLRKVQHMYRPILPFAVVVPSLIVPNSDKLTELKEVRSLPLRGFERRELKIAAVL